MFFRRLAFLLILLLPSFARADVFYPETFTLENGLQVIVVQNHLAPAVTQMVWYKVGSADEAAGKTGLAHYLEHLMFRGTAEIGPGEFSKRIAAQGGTDNAFTSYDYTSFHETVAADRLHMAMEMEADRMRNLQIKGETATPELHVVLDERQERTDNNPYGRFQEKVHHALMPDYPYGVPVIGWKREIEKLSVADAEDFYRRHYAPNNAVVIVSGDVDTSDVKRFAEETYGKLPKADAAPRHAFSQPGLPSATRVMMKDGRVEQPRIELHVLAPSYSTQKGNEAYALEVLGETLDSGQVGVLYRRLVIEQGLASGVETSYDPDARGDAIFTILVIPAPGKKAEKVEAALHAGLESIAVKGIHPKEIESAKERMQRAAIFARDSLMAPGYAFGSALTTGHTVQDVEEWPQRIKAVTPEDVNTALLNLIANRRTVTGLLLPGPKAPRARRDEQPGLSHSESIQ